MGKVDPYTPMRVRAVRIKGNNRTLPSVIEKELQAALKARTIAGILVGLERGVNGLRSTGAFKSVNVTMVEPRPLSRAEGALLEGDDREDSAFRGNVVETDLLVTVEENKVLSFSANAMFDDYRPTAKFQANLDNVFGTTEKISFNVSGRRSVSLSTEDGAGGAQGLRVSGEDHLEPGRSSSTASHSSSWLGLMDSNDSEVGVTYTQNRFWRGLRLRVDAGTQRQDHRESSGYVQHGRGVRAGLSTPGGEHSLEWEWDLRGVAPISADRGYRDFDWDRRAWLFGDGEAAAAAEAGSGSGAGAAMPAPSPHGAVAAAMGRPTLSPFLCAPSLLRECVPSVKSSLRYALNYRSPNFNHPLVPSEGTRASAALELAGLGGILGGDVSFAKAEAMVQQITPLGPRNVSGGPGAALSVSAKVGVLRSLSGQDSRIPDRFFLGGPLTFRGFRNRGVGCRSEAVPERSSGQGGSATLDGAGAGFALGGDLLFCTHAALSFPLLPFSSVAQALRLRGRVHATAGMLRRWGQDGDVGDGAGAGTGLGARDGRGTSAYVSGLASRASTAIDSALGCPSRNLAASAGVGVAMPLPFGRMEVNYNYVLRRGAGDREAGGFGWGLGVHWM